VRDVQFIQHVQYFMYSMYSMNSIYTMYSSLCTACFSIDQFYRSQNMGGVFKLPMCTRTTLARDRSLDSVFEGLVHLNLTLCYQTAVSCAYIQ